jgi:hypothetical protein
MELDTARNRGFSGAGVVGGEMSANQQALKVQ